MSDPCVNSNQRFGCSNSIEENAVSASLAEGVGNRLVAGTAHHVEGVENVIESGIGNHAEGLQNVITSEGNAVADPSENCHVEGITNRVGGFQNHVEGCNHDVNGFQAHVVGCNNKAPARVAGANLSGYGGYFLYDQSATFGADRYNYSNQLAGGLNDKPEFPGEGISIIDRTLANGVYPIGQHQCYRNTSDGLSYSVMLKGRRGLKEGTFVTLGDPRDNERMIVPAESDDEVIGVITNSSGFIANAGQFPATTRIRHDIFHNPIIRVNRQSQTPTKSKHSSKHNDNGENKSKHHPQHDQILFPGYQTVLRDGVDRSMPFVPYTEREGYYQVATSGLVVVRTDCADRLGRRCSIRNGVAVKGNSFWVVRIIDDSHVMILLK